MGMMDPWPEIDNGEPLAMPCTDCGDDVIVKGDPAGVAAAWASEDVTFLCLPCALLRGKGAG